MNVSTDGGKIICVEFVTWRSFDQSAFHGYRLNISNLHQEDFRPCAIDGGMFYGLSLGEIDGPGQPNPDHDMLSLYTEPNRGSTSPPPDGREQESSYSKVISP